MRYASSTHFTPWGSSQGSPFAMERKQSTNNSESISRETMVCTPRRKSSNVSSWSGVSVTTASRSPGACFRISCAASTGFSARAASKIKISAENFLAADIACSSVSACPTTRMSSSTAKILRSPARKMACESATMTRINCSLFSICGGATLGSPVLKAALAMGCLWRAGHPSTSQGQVVRRLFVLPQN